MHLGSGTSPSLVEETATRGGGGNFSHPVGDGEDGGICLGISTARTLGGLDGFEGEWDGLGGGDWPLDWLALLLPICMSMGE